MAPLDHFRVPAAVDLDSMARSTREAVRHRGRHQAGGTIVTTAPPRTISEDLDYLYFPPGTEFRPSFYEDFESDPFAQGVQWIEDAARMQPHPLSSDATPTAEPSLLSDIHPPSPAALTAQLLLSNELDFPEDNAGIQLHPLSTDARLTAGNAVTTEPSWLVDAYPRYPLDMHRHVLPSTMNFAEEEARLQPHPPASDAALTAEASHLVENQPPPSQTFDHPEEPSAFFPMLGDYDAEEFDALYYRLDSASEGLREALHRMLELQARTADPHPEPLPVFPSRRPRRRMPNRRAIVAPQVPSDVDATGVPSGSSGTPTAVGGSLAASPANPKDAPHDCGRWLRPRTTKSYKEPSEDDFDDSAEDGHNHKHGAECKRKASGDPSSASSSRPAKRQARGRKVSDKEQKTSETSAPWINEDGRVICNYHYTGQYADCICTETFADIDNYKRHLEIHALVEAILIALGILDLEDAPLLSGAAMGTRWRARISRCPECGFILGNRSFSLLRHGVGQHQLTNPQTVALNQAEVGFVNGSWRPFEISMFKGVNLGMIGDFRRLGLNEAPPAMLQARQAVLHEADKWWDEWFGPL